MSFLNKNLSKNIISFFKKSTFLLILAGSLGAILFLRPYFNGFYEKPSIYDRLPEADFIGRCNILDLARETNDMLFYNKIPFRDLMSYEFILGQGKSYGLNLQKPIYFFANESGNWGAIIELSDSSKVFPGIERLKKFIDIKDTLYDEQTVYKYEDENTYLTYGNNWLFVYKGSNFNNNFYKIINAKKGQTELCWKKFLKEKQFKDDKLVICSNWEKLKEQGVEKALFAHDSDSISFNLKAYFKNNKNLNFSEKDSGIELYSNQAVRNQINLHFNIENLRKNPNDPLYQLLIKLGKKISFPTKDFIDTWEGDISFNQGGFAKIHETFVESVLDEEFNVTEVKKVKEEIVPGFSVLLSVNNNSRNFINKLFAKGILTKHEKHFQFLASPPLTFVNRPGSLLFYSGESFPKIIYSNSNYGVWTRKGTKIDIKIDSINRKEVFGSIHFPVDRIIRRSKFF